MAVKALTWTDSRRVLRVATAQSSYLEVAENYNAGWQAVLGGKALTPVRLDGWEQAWLLPAGSRGLVTLTYQPDRIYRDALFGGLALLAVVLAIALLPRRRRRDGRSAGPLASGEAASPGSGAAPLAARVAGLAVLIPAGLWLGGYPGALLLPAAAMTFLLAGLAGRARGGGWCVVQGDGRLPRAVQRVGAGRAAADRGGGHGGRRAGPEHRGPPDCPHRYRAAVAVPGGGGQARRGPGGWAQCGRSGRLMTD